MLGRGGADAGRRGALFALFTGVFFGLQIAASFQMERDEGPHEFGLKQTDRHQAIDAHDLNVEVARGHVEAAGGSGQRQSVPKSENAQRDAEQTGDDEERVKDGEGVLGQSRFLGEMQQTSHVTEGLHQILDQQQAQRHASEIQHVGRDGTHWRE